MPLSAVYSLVTRAYHRRADHRQPYRSAVPVISIGNILVGGTGKTPCVIALAQLLAKWYPVLAEPNRIAILSRGYGRESRGTVVVEATDDCRRSGDEPLLIKRSLPNALVVVDADRSRAARWAVEARGAKIMLLDDGFQHRRIARDVNLVLVDGSYPLGNGRLLPAGPLREPVEALSRATALIAVGGDSGAAEKLAKKWGKPCLKAKSIPRLPASLPSPCFAFCAIARPNRFFKSIIDKNIDICGTRAFRDHHRFTEAELAEVAAEAQRSGANTVVTTAKDRVRILKWPEGLPLEVADLEFRFDLEEEVRQLVAECRKFAPKDG